MAPFTFTPLKHNDAVCTLARLTLRARNRGLERLFFTATTGRSGTLTLAKLFSVVPGCIALHEPHPIMNGAILRAASYGDGKLVDRAYRQVKSINILRAAAGHRYYLEANHLFVKTFAEHAIDDFRDRITVIHLVRPAIEVATSIYRLRDCPGTEIGNFWWLDYHAPANLIQIGDILDSDKEYSHPFYKALWYWYEIEMRISDLRQRRPLLNVVRFETDWFNDRLKVFQLLDGLGFDYERPQVEAMVGHREHLREGQKKGDALPGAQAQDMFARFREFLAHRGVNLSNGLPPNPDGK